MNSCMFIPYGGWCHMIKCILLFWTVCGLLVTGCAPINRVQGEPAGGVDHGEHPGDLDHGDTMQR